MKHRSPSSRVVGVWILLAVAGCASVRGEPLKNTFPLHGDSVLKLASVEEGQSVLTAHDAFANSLSRFDLQSRLDTDREVTTDELLKFAADQVLRWSEEDARHVGEVVEALKKKLAPLKSVFPREVLLIQTTGREEGNAAYTRGTAIILPTSKVKLGAAQLERLLVHELFHVLSRHDAELRKKLYAIVGFTVCDDIPLPDELRKGKITNPDAPRIDCVIGLTFDGEKTTCAPILIASADQYEPGARGGFFKYLQFRLLEVEAEVNGYRPKPVDGAALLHEPQDADNFFGQIGRNTRYIIHPDEILADNFIHLVLKSQNLDTPRIIEEMAKELAAP